jgi:hypothetical protein
VTFPFEIRPRLAYDGKALGAVGRIFMDSVLGFYRRRMRDEGIRDGRSGAVMVVQRNSADLKLNPHMHAIFVDGVFATDLDGKPVFDALPRLSTEEVGDLIHSALCVCAQRFRLHYAASCSALGLPGAGAKTARCPRGPAWIDPNTWTS